MNAAEEILLFPLNVVLFPEMILPLHIFEERYKRMIEECIERRSEFGVVFGADERFADVGCAALVTAVIQRLPDGRLNILSKGTGRFRVLRRLSGPLPPSDPTDRPSISALVEPFEDDPEQPDQAVRERVSRLYHEAMRLTLGWFDARTLLPASLTPEALSFLVASHLALTMEAKQAILEMSSANARLHRVAGILEGSMAGLREIRRRAGGNGHLA